MSLPRALVQREPFWGEAWGALAAGACGIWAALHGHALWPVLGVSLCLAQLAALAINARLLRWALCGIASWFWALYGLAAYASDPNQALLPLVAIVFGINLASVALLLRHYPGGGRA